MHNKTLSLLLLPNLPACESMNAEMGYKLAVETPSRVSDRTVETYPEALRNTRPIQIIENTINKSAIQISDAKFNTNDNFIYYKVFILPIIGEYQLKINSICTCVSFSKKLIPPFAVLLDADGNKIIHNILFKPGSRWELPINVEALLNSKNIPFNARYIMITSSIENRNSSYSTTEYIAYPIPIPINIKYEKTGELWVKHKPLETQN